jgi:basic membrane lipoprotein Med (substrate-binding protein (PBP1-ABC) superfamily)
MKRQIALLLRTPAASSRCWPYRRRIATGALVAVAGCIAAAVALSGSSPTAAPVRARQYTTHQACLLTGPGGVSSGTAATVWAGMQDASLATHAKVSYLAAYGPATASNAVAYANTLLQRDCDLLLGADTAPDQVLAQVAQASPHTRFLLVAGNTPGRANVRTLPGSSDLRERVTAAVEAAVTG